MTNINKHNCGKKQKRKEWKILLPSTQQLGIASRGRKEARYAYLKRLCQGKTKRRHAT